MGDLSARNFGLVIAYLVPGFITVVAVGRFTSTMQPWLAAPEGQPTVGGFLFVTLASIAAGMLVSSVRWMLVDTIHHRTGVQPPRWNFSILESNLAAYNLLVEFHYRYYKFYGNTFVAIGAAYFARVLSGCGWCGGMGWMELGFVMIEAVLLAASRDALRKYYERGSQVLGPAASRRRGVSHDERRRSRTRVGDDGSGRDGETETSGNSETGERDAAEAGASPPDKGSEEA